MYNVHIKNFLVVLKPNQDEKELQTEMKLLEALLPKATGLSAVAHCTEIADLNKYQLISSPKKVMQSLLNYSPNKAFVFLICSN
jgi:hypothetical protein